MTRYLKATTFGALLLVLPFLATGSALAERRISQTLYHQAKEIQEGRGGGVLSHGWHVTKGTVLAGACGFGLGYALGGPSLAVDLGTRSAGAGALWRSFQVGRSGLYRPSERAFAQACLAEIDGKGFKKQFCKIKGIILGSLETGASNAFFLGGLGALTAGPTGIVANGTAGFVGGALFGLGSGICRAYVVPGVRSLLMNHELSKAEKALDKLDRSPGNAKLHDQAEARLAKVIARAERIPLLTTKQTERFDQLRARVAGHSNLAGIAAALR